MLKSLHLTNLIRNHFFQYQNCFNGQRFLFTKIIPEWILKKDNEKHLIRPPKTSLPLKSIQHVKNIILVASGKGGVGKSTVAGESKTYFNC